MELGPRSHLELRSLIESTTLTMADESEENGDNESKGQLDDIRQELLGQLPQILFY